MGQSNYVHLEGCRIVRESEKAFLVEVPEADDPEPVWIPKSQIADEGEGLAAGDTDITLSITEWIANEKGLV